MGSEDLAVGGQHGRVRAVGLRALAWDAGKVLHPGGVQDADRDGGLVEGGPPVAFGAAGGFADDLSAGLAGQEMDEPVMAGGAVEQVVKATGPLELEVVLGNIQARGESRVPGVRTPCCPCERARQGRSLNGWS